MIDRDRIIVALDTSSADEALELARRLRGRATHVKVGMTLFYATGPSIVSQLRELGFDVFVDLKLHDIPHQVSGAVRSLAGLGASMLTVHGAGGRAMLEAAARAAMEAEADGIPRAKLIAITVLTSMDAASLAEVGIARPLPLQAASLAYAAREAGIDGVVCSPKEAEEMRELLGPAALVVTPGVRPAWASANDQARVATPADALALGASHLVIGRPITAADDPVAAFERIVEEG